jgi:hypothetical protein
VINCRFAAEIEQMYAQHAAAAGGNK